MLGNRAIMASNIRRLLILKNTTQKDMCDILNIPDSTVSSWMQEKSYPRIDRIEKLAKYFGVKKSALVEEYNPLDKNYLIDEIERNYHKLTPNGQQKLKDYLNDLLKNPDNLMEKD